MCIARRHTNPLVPKDLISIVSKVKILYKDSHKGNHGKTSIVNLLVLIIHPSLITIVYPIGSSKDITRLISRTSLNLLSEPLNSSASKDKLEPSNGGKLLGSLKGVGGEGAVEGGVDSSSSDVPSEAGGHGDAAVFELGFAVEVHDLVGFSRGESEGIEEAHGSSDSDDVLVFPCLERGGGADVGLGDGGEGRAVVVGSRKEKGREE